MYKIISSSKDAYITNKIINNKFRATDANTGQAGTLDLFKLYAENIIGLDRTPIELSRILIKFNLDDVKSMHDNQKIDVGDDSFKAYIKLFDVYGGQTTPNNFKLIAMPLAMSFNEGAGYDIVNFSDLDNANYVTASYDLGVINKWNSPGAMKSGSLGDENIDVIISGTLPGQLSPINFSSEQLFLKGTEDLLLDVTNFVSASVKSLIDNHGFVISYSGSFEKNEKTYFVKRFASRDSLNKSLRPQLIINFNDSLIDNHQDFEFDLTGSLYLNNFYRGQLSNIKTGLSAEELTGENCMILKIQTGSFSKQFNVSQVPRGGDRLTGIYSSSFAISSFDSSLYNHILSSGSINFQEIWSSNDESITYLSSSLTITKNNITAISYSELRFNITLLNLKHRYKQDETARIRVYAQNAERELVFVKKPIETPSEIFPNMFYRVRDTEDGKIIIPFDQINNSTKLSADSKGMYFDFYMSSLQPGRTYSFDFLIKHQGYDKIIEDAASKFIIE